MMHVILLFEYRQQYLSRSVANRFFLSLQWHCLFFVQLSILPILFVIYSLEFLLLYMWLWEHPD